MSALAGPRDCVGPSQRSTSELAPVTVGVGPARQKTKAKVIVGITSSPRKLLLFSETGFRECEAFAFGNRLCQGTRFSGTLYKAGS